MLRQSLLAMAGAAQRQRRRLGHRAPFEPRVPVRKHVTDPLAPIAVCAVGLVGAGLSQQVGLSWALLALAAGHSLAGST